MKQKLIIIGGPSTGKTTMANALAEAKGIACFHSDDLIGRYDWSEASQFICDQWLTLPGPWVMEGVAVVRGLRKWLRANPTGVPCTGIIWLDQPHEELNNRQKGMAKGCLSIWNEIKDEVIRRGVELDEPEVTLSHG